MLIDQSIARVRAYRRSKGWTIHRYATEAKLAESTIRPMDDENWKPNAETLRALESVIPPTFEAA